MTGVYKVWNWKRKLLRTNLVSAGCDVNVRNFLFEKFLWIFHENVRILLQLNNDGLKISFENSIGLFGSTSLAVAWLMSYEHCARFLPLCVLLLFYFGKEVRWRISGKNSEPLTWTTMTPRKFSLWRDGNT